MNTVRPALEVAVVLDRVRGTGPSSHWQPWRWELADVVVQELGFGTAARILYENDSVQRWLHPGYRVELFKDDVQGYELNLAAQRPCWFVLWRLQEGAADPAQALARPEVVSLSYVDAGRWLDAQETVEQVPAPWPVVQWLQAFVNEHLVQEPQRRKRPESFRSLSDRFGNPASVSTHKRGGGAHG